MKYPSIHPVTNPLFPLFITLMSLGLNEWTVDSPVVQSTSSIIQTQKFNIKYLWR